MIKLIHKAWTGIFKNALDIFIATLPYRMHVVIVANGGSTRW